MYLRVVFILFFGGVSLVYGQKNKLLDYDFWLTATPEDVHAELEKGADVNARNTDGRTALMWAIREGTSAVIKVLLAAGADVNLGDKYGTTPLMFAISENRLNVINVLLAADADVNAKKYGGKTPLM